MALLNDIKKMQGEGKTEQEIIAALRKQGISPKEIIESLSQTKIKEAVSGESPVPEPYAAPETPAPQAQQSQQDALMPPQSQEMQPSQYAPQAQEQPMEYQPTQPSQQMPEQYQEYPQQQYVPQSAGISPDTISEIAEQVVSEKLSKIRKDMENLIDMKSTLGTKVSLLDERIKRIESIIDRLNLSIMQKVGDYMTNISDIKKELIETQKSFKSMSNKPQQSQSQPKKQFQQPKQFKDNNFSQE